MNKRRTILLAAAATVIVVAIIAAAVLIRVPRSRWTRCNTPEKLVERDLQAIVQTVELFRSVNGRYPATIEELTTLLSEEEQGPLPERVIDLWGRPYRYRLAGGKPHASCLGRDGFRGGEGEDRDLEFPEPDGKN